jgi:hypothetical protein
MAGLEDRYTRKPAGRSLPTTAAHRRRNGTDEKKPPVGGCPPCVFGLPNPVASFFATTQDRPAHASRQEFRVRRLSDLEKWLQIESGEEAPRDKGYVAHHECIEPGHA